MLHYLRGKTLPLATRLLSHSSAVCRPCFSFPVAARLYQRPPTFKPVPMLHLSGWNLSTRLGLHTDSQRKKRKKETKEHVYLTRAKYYWQEMQKAPKPAYVLTLAGAVPFVSVPVIMCCMQLYIPLLATLQVYFGACILSFIGGVRWGYSLPDNSPVKPNWMNFATGGVISFFAFFNLMLVNAEIMSGVFGIGLGFFWSLLVDLIGFKDVDLASINPRWYKCLRVMLTVIVLFSLIATGVCSMVYPELVDPTDNPVTPQKAPKKFQ